MPKKPTLTVRAETSLHREIAETLVSSNQAVLNGDVLEFDNPVTLAFYQFGISCADLGAAHNHPPVLETQRALDWMAKWCREWPMHDKDYWPTPEIIAHAHAHYLADVKPRVSACAINCDVPISEATKMVQEAWNFVEGEA